MSPYGEMARNNAWANATLLAAARGLAHGALQSTAPGFFPSLHATLAHILAVDRYYLDALEEGGVGRAVYDTPEPEDLDALAAAQAACDARLTDFCDALSTARLAETRLTDRPGGPVAETVGALLLHLFQHQVHHRGQAHVQLQSLGVAPPQLDEFHLAYDRAPTAAAFGA